MMNSIFPGLVLIAGAAFVPVFRGRARSAWVILLPVLGLWHLWTLPDGHRLSVELGSYSLDLVRVDRLSRLFGTLFHIAAILSFVFAWHVRSAVEQCAALVYAGATIAATFAGDLLSLFAFWEVTAVGSVLLIWARGTERAYRAGMRYLVVQVTSGLLLFGGAILRLGETGGLAFEHIGLSGLGAWLIFFAFGIKAAFPLLHNWLQDAYPEATVSGTVILSAFTTKLAVYALVRGFAGTELLIPIGTVMTAFPIFYAVIENDLRRVLTYSMNNQIGFMVVGIGVGTPLAVNGAVSHAFADVLFKALLFMSMGAVLYRTGTVKGSELGGLYKSMPWTTVFCIVGAASISGFPLFSAFATKSMILEATAQGHLLGTYLALLFASAGVFHHSGIKIPFFAFFAHDSGRRVPEAPAHMLLAMAGAAVLCIGIGVHPDALYALLPHPVDYAPYTVSHVVMMLELLIFSAAAFAFLRRTGLYPPELASVNLDTDWFYRRVGPWVVLRVAGAARALGSMLASARGQALRGLDAVLGHYYAPPGILGEPWTTSAAALWAALMLGTFLLLYYL